METATIVFSVKGMTCGACSSTIEEQTASLYKNEIKTHFKDLNVQNFECTVSLITEECLVKFNFTSVEDWKDKLDRMTLLIIEAIEDCGFDCELISLTFTNTNFLTDGEKLALIFKIGGMTCGACSSTITNQISSTICELENDSLLIKGAHNNCNVSLITEECIVNILVENKSSIDLIKSKICEDVEDCGFECDFISVKELDTIAKSADYLKRSITLEILTELDDIKIQEITKDLKTKKEILSFDFVSDNRKDIQIKCNNQRLENKVFFNLNLSYKITSFVNIRALIDYLKTNFDIESIPIIGNSAAIQQQQLDSLNRTKEIAFWKNNMYISGLIALLAMTFYMLIPMFFNHKHVPSFGPYQLISSKFFKISYVNLVGLCLASYLQFGPLGSHFWKACKKSFRKLTGTMDTLVFISTISAYFFSIYSIVNMILFNGQSEILFDTSTMLFAFICFGKFLENTARAKTSFVLSKIMTMSPNTALLYDEENGLSQEISSILIEINDILEIKPGSKIPCDGTVYTGICEIDEQIITGEATPVTKNIGDSLCHGSVNGHSRFLMKAKKVGDDTSLLKLLDILKNAQLSKAPMQELADKLASKFVPFVVVLSFISFVFWMLYCKFYGIPKVFMGSENDKDKDHFVSDYFFEIFKVAVSVIIVACPCALGLAAPTCIIVGTGLSAENGILMKNGKILQNFQNIDTFVMDKTGTLTLGKLFVEKFETYDGIDSKIGENELLTMILLAESASEHSVALSIVNYCTEVGALSQVDRFCMKSIEINVGLGVYGEFEDKETGLSYTLSIGNKNTLSKESIKKLEFEIAKNGIEFVGTNAYISLNSKLVGQFLLNDELKTDSKDVLFYLSNVLEKEIFMCTGDNRLCAYKFGDELGIPRENIKYEVTPLEKHDLVASLQEEGKKVVFVGDGINDSLALVKADLGVSIINEGLDIVMESSDVVIMNNTNLIQLIYCLEIAQITFNKIKSNFFWSLVYNVFMLPVAMGMLVPFNITLNPIVAGASMALSSVSVVVNSLLIRSWEPTDIEGYASSGKIGSFQTNKFNKLLLWFKKKTSKLASKTKYQSVINRESGRIYEMV
ncbi:hypothetical protein QEN19_002228 [Hanseniaspora menglaensis]